MKLKTISTFMVIALLILATGVVTAAPLGWMDIGPDDSADTTYTLMVGESFTADVFVSDLPEVYTMGFKITFDPAQLALTSAQVYDDPQQGWPFKPTVSTGLGSADLMGGSPLGVAHSGEVKLATLTFECLGQGISLLDLGPTDILGAGFYTGSGVKIDDTIVWQDVEVRQQVVPLPPALLLFGSGLLGLMGIGRKRLSFK